MEDAQTDMRYFLYARGSLDRWQSIVGCHVTHERFGDGTVTNVGVGSDGDPIIFVEFCQAHGGPAERRFDPRAFDGLFTRIAFPTAIAADVLTSIQASELEEEEERLGSLRRDEIALMERAQAEAGREAAKERSKAAEQYAVERQFIEAESARHFAELKIKYDVSDFGETRPISPLYKILVDLDESGSVVPSDVLWLQRRRLHGPLAAHFKNRYELDRDPWDAIRASSSLRKIGRSMEALDLTATLSSSDPKVMAALLTTRGGALRDDRRLDEAQASAMHALTHDPVSFYPYNLLGAIAYERGLPEEGDRHFQRALELGASTESQDKEIRFSVERASDADRVKVAKFLLSKDPERYFWAAHYLRPQVL